MNINSEDESSYTIQYQQVSLKYGENEYRGKSRWFPVIQPESVPINNLFPSAMDSAFG